MNEDDIKFEKTQRALTHSHELQNQKDLLEDAGRREGGSMNGSVTHLW